MKEVIIEVNITFLIFLLRLKRKDYYALFFECEKFMVRYVINI